ncbi:50S ribosomal protein L22 [Insulibacter thermoxylanivorax]|uniref:Large ribosomal subunit protein uL22 n=1 Tax=Insulibacter thermoxylanivorax TaxID=2749268 RepID=A0A916QDQ0_9BACL|nr:50S ribosomal protein L22 [Insulibacter thermoxylanivorax]GFR38846.1 50S ribosomal protein L22 [Insulibacter thermoxylanivorax]
MQQAKAVARYVRISPRKARLVVDLIRGKRVDEAFAILRHTPRAASPILEKLLNSAVANAEHNYSMDVANLVISEAYVNEGPIMKRYQPRAQGRAYRINKRTSHITLVVSEK